DDGPGAYEIAVLSAHEGTAAPVSVEHQKAELDAGKHASEPVPGFDVKRGEEREAKLFAQCLDPARTPFRHGADDDKIDRATVRVPASPDGDAVSFAVASCRYPGWLVDRQQADSAFGRLGEELNAAD